jgi:hypothetical protein
MKNIKKLKIFGLKILILIMKHKQIKIKHIILDHDSEKLLKNRFNKK